MGGTPLIRDASKMLAVPFLPRHRVGLSHMIPIRRLDRSAPRIPRGKLHAERRDLRSTISGLSSREGLSARDGVYPERRRVAPRARCQTGITYDSLGPARGVSAVSASDTPIGTLEWTPK